MKYDPPISALTRSSIFGLRPGDPISNKVNLMSRLDQYGFSTIQSPDGTLESRTLIASRPDQSGSFMVKVDQAGIITDVALSYGGELIDSEEELADCADRLKGQVVTNIGPTSTSYALSPSEWSWPPSEMGDLLSSLTWTTGQEKRPDSVEESGHLQEKKLIANHKITCRTHMRRSLVIQIFSVGSSQD